MILKKLFHKNRSIALFFLPKGSFAILKKLGLVCFPLAPCLLCLLCLLRKASGTSKEFELLIKEKPFTTVKGSFLTLGQEF